jgi:glucose-1-phosphate thymidylyltransferase
VKGIVLAGGAGTRLHPATLGLSKQLLPVYDKPMVYYPLSTLMLAGIREILVISTPHDLPLFRRLLGDGSQLGISLAYAEQDRPRGLADAFVVGREFVGGDDVALILGDNIFHGEGLADILQAEVARLDGCTLFGYRVRDPERYGVADAGADGVIRGIEEKPASPRSNLAVTGLYLYDNGILDVAGNLAPSARGEIEITDANNAYVGAGRARLVELGRGMAWLDTGTHDSLIEASQFIQVLQHRQDLRIACLEEVAFRMGFIGEADLEALAQGLGASSYGDYVRSLRPVADHGMPPA